MNQALSLSSQSSFQRLLPWLVWGMSGLFVTFQMLLQTAPSVMISDLQQAFSIDTLGVSLLASSFFYTYILFQVPSGMLIDRVSPRYCLSACLIGIALCSFAYISTESLNIAKGSRILQGVFSAPSVVPALYLAANWFPAKRFALLAGLTEMIGMLGAAAGEAFLAPSVSSFGWRSTISACAWIGIVLALFMWLVVRDKPEEVMLIKTPKVKTSIFSDLMAVIACPQSWINGVFCGLLFSIAAAFASFWCVPYLMAIYPITLNMAAAASSMALLGVALGAPCVGWISDKIGLRKLPMTLCTAVVLVIIMAILYLPGIHLGLMFLLLFLLGFFSSVYAISFAVMRDIVPEHVRGTAMGYTNLMCILIGAPLLQPLIGWILDRELKNLSSPALAYQHALSLLPLCIACGVVLSFFVKETHCGRQDVQSS